MTFTKKQLRTLTWVIRILALVVLLFGLPFYFGYGNPLPFINPEYTVWDNLWLSVFPLMFIGLGLGWKYEKIAGYLIVIPLFLALVVGFILERELVGPMLVPLALGGGYLFLGYEKGN